MELQLKSGRTISLKELHQSSVYEGVLEGAPTHADNARLVAGLVERVAELFGAPVEMIPPTERTLDRSPTRRGQPALIPKIASAGRFVSRDPARDPSMHGSQLVLLWFQEELGLTDQQALDSLKTVDWNSKATDFEY